MIATQTNHWERQLLDMAHAGLRGHHPARPVQADEALLAQAYAYTADLTRTHSRTFYLASGLLPREKRRAVRSLYAFCRVSDDMVDRLENPDYRGVKAREQLQAWQDFALSDPETLVPENGGTRVLPVPPILLERSNPAKSGPISGPEIPRYDLITLAWADTRARFYVPRLYAEQLIDGVASDLDHDRYGSFGELAAYSYGVASTVGLMAMHIIGFTGPQAIPFAIKLGVALQLTNILRDVGEDWRNGRFYLPQDELAFFNLTEEDVAAGKLDERWREFMRFQIGRTRRLYEEADPGIALLDREGRFAIAAAADLYQGILDDIEAHDYDVFNRRAHLSKREKLAKLPSIWFRVR